MYHLKNRMIEPYGGWRYRDPDLKVTLRTSTFNSLVQAVRDMRSVNKLTSPPDLAGLVEDWVCRNTHRDFVVLETGEAFLGAVNSADMINAMTRFSGIRAMDKAGSLHKASICRGCHHNTPTVCLPCTGHDDRFRADYGLDRMEHDNVLHVCQVDATANMATVQMRTEDVLARSVPRGAYPPNCWKTGEIPCRKKP